MKKLKNWGFYGVLIVLVALVESKEPPRILANDVDSFGSISVLAGSTLTLNCEGVEPVKWKTHGRNDMLSRATEDTPAKANFESKYQSTLEIADTVFTDTGRFSCKYENNMESNDPENNAEIYVFVNDPKKVLIPVSIPFISVIQGTETIIPCLPSNRKANVTLWQGIFNNGKNIATDDFNLQFDPTRGFILNWAPATFSGQFYCLGNLGNVTDQVTLYLQWMPSTDVVPAPTIQVQPKFAILKEVFVLDCIVRSPSRVLFFLEWTTPTKITDESRVKIGEVWSSERKRDKGDNFLETRRNITIKSVRQEDVGTYTCKASDHTQKSNEKSIYVDVKEEAQSFIKFSLGDGNPNEAFEQQVGTSVVKFAVKVDSYPSDPTLKWYKGDVPLSNSNKHKIINSPKMSVLEIYNIARRDTGFYTLVGTTGQTTEELKLTLVVYEKPDVSIRPEPPMFKKGDDFKIQCHIEGCPGSNITWMWSLCQSPTCDRRFITLTESLDNMELETEEYGEISDGCLVRSVLSGTAIKPGYYKCFAQNVLGSNESEAPLFIKEFKTGFDLSASDRTPYEGEELTLNCHASLYKYSQITWYWVAKNDGINRNTVTNTSNILVKPSETLYSFIKDVIIKPVDQTVSGDYICQAKFRDSNKWEEKRLQINVIETSAPKIIETNLNDTDYTVFKEGHFEFTCKTTGSPPPQIRWYLNGTLIQAINDTAIQFLEKNSKLYIARTLPSDSGRYVCLAANSAGVVNRTATLKVLNAEQPGGLSKGGVVGIVVFIIVAIILIIAGSIILGRRFYHEKKEKNEWEQLQHQLFDQGDVGHYNPELPLDEQVDTLPYDRSWEVPKERLRLGRVLGQGAFGRVLKGEIHNFVEGQEWTTVAVKMLKERADNEQRKALMQELKIMIHIGRHVNVVNLVGAVTKNLCKGELQVLVEYCKYGNLRHYLLKHRDNFIDQINLTTGEFDKDVQRAGNVFRFSDSLYNSNSASNSVRTEMTIDSGGVDNTGARLSGIASPTVNTARQLTTYDLICFSYQIAAGMIYLGSKKLVHRDLALRNILLADGDVVKICDFGLAKDVYRKNYYRKRGQGPLPYKWMAIESIRDKVYTAESDVWSYGILLWEIYTLGANPYPGMEVDDDFYNKLNSGYRMEKPQLAPKSMFHLMSQCWLYEPRSRPTFQEINNNLSAIMDPETVQNYVQLNEDYLRREVPFGHNLDYLSQFSGDLDAYVGVDPDSAPHRYVNSESEAPVHVNATTGNVNYVNLLHPNDSNGLNHQRALTYGERASDHPELAPMITSGHYLLPPTPKKLARASNDDDSYLDMGSKVGINQGTDEDNLTVRSGNKTRSSPPPRNS